MIGSRWLFMDYSKAVASARRKPPAVDYFALALEASPWVVVRLFTGSCNSSVEGSLRLLIDYFQAVATAAWLEASVLDKFASRLPSKLQLQLAGIC